ncbi:MAG: nucleotide exchange factor GrpE [Desulfobacterales bacterium S3730MH5]|nr:MAG: nucleotide exchange factor GrpE [Desulfobacterales bacterium S3730MH5]
MTDSKNGHISSEAAEEPDKDTPKPAKKKIFRKQSLKERLEAAEKKAESNYERLLRMTAEFENYKKRSEREMNDFRKFANESLIKEILPVVDNLERALDTRNETNSDALEGIREGVEMTLKGLKDSLKKFGVAPMDALGKPFDPNFHQAVSQEEREGYAENTVSKELQKGYMLSDRLLRPSMVVISKMPGVKVEVRSPADADEDEDEDESKIEIKNRSFQHRSQGGN